MKIILSFIYFIPCYIFFLKKWYELFAIIKVYIPDFIDHKSFFVNDTPLITLEKRRNAIIILTITIIVLIAIFFYGVTFYLTLASLITSFFTSFFTFRAAIYENQIFKIFSDYLKKKI